MDYTLEYGNHDSHFMKKIFETFSNSIRGKRRREFNVPFWDVIVISTMDNEQKVGYDIQIAKKIESKELPLDVPFHVIPDPEGGKIGNGGSTMHCIHTLHKLYGDDIYTKRILLVHAGGMSQRLPSVSVPGKIFLSFPIGDPMYQALEVVLCTYMPFLKRMGPGVLVTCSDMLLTYELQEGNDDYSWTFLNKGFTVLGHPSPIFEGEKHGVYVVDGKLSEEECGSTTCIKQCTKVLQKPSYIKMQQSGAIIQSKDSKGKIYSDSCFFFDSDIARNLKKFYEENMPINCEIDAYGDFLPALGKNSTIDHIENTNNVINVNPSLRETRHKVYKLLKDCDITLILMNKSRFYHVGTLPELIHHFSMGTDLINKMMLKRFICSKFLGEKQIAPNVQGVVMQSLIDPRSVIPKSSIVNYCHFKVPINVGLNTIISNCSIDVGKSSVVQVPSFIIPDNMMFHTIPIEIDDQKKFITVAFGINDDIKKQPKNINNIVELKYVDLSLQNVLNKLDMDSCSAFSNETYNLWNARLFTPIDTMEESFRETYGLIMAIKGGCDQVMPSTTNNFCKHRRLSMSEILKIKITRDLVQYRFDLKDQINKV